MTRPVNRAVIVAFVIVLWAFVLRIFRIGAQEFWYDEAFSFHMATIQSGLWEALRIENSPPLYYLFLRAWVPIAGISESVVRLPSAFFGAMGTAAVIAAGWRLFDARVGLWAGAVMALSPIHIYYSQEARGYALLICALALTYLLLVRALERPSPGRWALTGLMGALAVYTHYGALIGFIPTLLFLWWWPSAQPLRTRVLGYLGAFLLMLICIGPWLVWCFVLIMHPFGPGDSMAQVWEKVPPALAIPKTLQLFTIGHQSDTYPNLPKVYPSLEFPKSLNMTAIGLLFLLALWNAVPWGDHRLGITNLARRKALLWSWLLVPLAVLWLVTLRTPLYTLGRYDLIAFPAFTLLVGLSLAKLQALPRRGRLLASAAGLLLTSLLALKLHLYYQLVVSAPPVPSAQKTAAVVASQVKTGDVVTFSLSFGTPMLYYLYKLGFRWHDRECGNPATGHYFGCRIFPPEDEETYGLPATPLPLNSFVRELLLSLKGADNVIWVLLNRQSSSDAVFLSEFAQLDLEPVGVPVDRGAILVALRRR